MPAADFIAQLRTYVIATGLSPQVVDAVDNLCGIDDLEAKHHTELQELEFATAKETKDEILKAVTDWADKSLGPKTKKALLNVIENA